MRIVLIGSDNDRARLRGLLEKSNIEIAGEATTLAEGRAQRRDADAFIMANGQPQSDLLEPLTPRELEVVELLAEGLSNQAIASRLGISEHTVKFHVSSICGKLGAENRTDAVRRAVRQGLITL